MKRILFLSILAFPLSVTAQAQPAVGSISVNQSFAVRNGTGFLDSNLDAYEGSILVIMLMTPWCPICQTNSVAVGDGILDHFNNRNRGNLVGKNANGIQIRSILLSTETASNFDDRNTPFLRRTPFNNGGSMRIAPGLAPESC